MYNLSKYKVKMINLNSINQEFEKLNINVHNFNHINVILIIIASIVASVGLLTNNYQSVIASKIIGLALIPFLSFSILLLYNEYIASTRDFLE